MIAGLTRDQVFIAIGAGGADKSLPAAVAAEYARTAMLGLCDGPPVTAQRLTGEIEDQLTPLIRFRSATVDIYFADGDDELESTPARQAVTDLVEIGDFTDVGHGYHYATPIRTVRIDDGWSLIIGGAPTSQIEAAYKLPTRAKTMGRLTRTPATGLPEQTMKSWLGTPSAELKQWTTEQLTAALDRSRVCADAWEAATFDLGRLQWTPVSKLADLSEIHICREPRESVKGHRKFLAQLSLAGGIVSTTGLRPISHLDCSRLIHGKQLLRGLSRRLWVTDRPDFFTVKLSRYTLPEILRLLKALCHDWHQGDDDRLSFLIPAELRPCVQTFIARYAMHLAPHPHEQ